MPRQPDQGPFIHIDASAGEGLQAQIYQAVRAAILDGRLPPGARVWSSRALAATLAVSRTTTVLVYDRLVAEGYLQGRHGAGFFVAASVMDVALRPARASVRPSLRGARPESPLSRRAARLAAVPAAAERVSGPPRAFRLGVPALDLVPVRTWSQLVTRRLRSLTRSQLDYGHPAGQYALREAIAAYVRTARGARCTAADVFIVPGAQRGLQLVAQAVLDPQEVGVVETPGFPGAVHALLSVGAKVQTVAVDHDGLVVQDLTRLKTARLVYVTPSHQFPLGAVMSLPRRLALLRWATLRDGWIVEDDYDSEFRYGGRPMPCLQGLDAERRVVYVGTFSKSLFPGLRLGFLIAPPRLHAALTSIRRAAESHPSVIEQLALADFVGNGHYERHVRRMRAVYRERAGALREGAERYCRGALTLRPIEAGLHGVADLGDGLRAERVFAEAATRGVEVMPLAAYGASPSNLGEALVLGVGAVAPDLAIAGMARLASALDASRRRRGRA